MAIDPVCGMTVDEKTAPATAVHNGTTYYFCAPGCKRTFEKDPAAVLRERGQISNLSPGGPPAQPAMMMPMRRVGPPTLTLPRQGGGMTALSAKPVTLTIPIEGMSCASCVATIERG